jgi:hypothetical protein
MLSRIRPRLTYANLMSSLAVFLALGGSAYALSANSVGSKELKKNAAGPKHIKNPGVRAFNIAPNHVRARHIQTDHVRTRHIAPGAVTEESLADGVAVSGPQGPKGDQGESGPQGPVGPKGDKGDPGEPATRLFARVASNGSLLAGSPGATATKLAGTGDYEVSWGPQDLTSCAAAATRSTGAFGQGLIRRSVSPTANNRIRIIAQDTSGSNQDIGFDLAVFC